MFVAAVFSCVATAACAITQRSRWDRCKLLDALRSAAGALVAPRCANCARGVNGRTALPGATWPLGVCRAFMLKQLHMRSCSDLPLPNVYTCGVCKMLRCRRKGADSGNRSIS